MLNDTIQSLSEKIVEKTIKERHPVLFDMLYIKDLKDIKSNFTEKKHVVNKIYKYELDIELRKIDDDNVQLVFIGNNNNSIKYLSFLISPEYQYKAIPIKYSLDLSNDDYTFHMDKIDIITMMFYEKKDRINRELKLCKLTLGNEGMQYNQLPQFGSPEVRDFVKTLKNTLNQKDKELDYLTFQTLALQKAMPETMKELYSLKNDIDLTIIEKFMDKLSYTPQYYNNQNKKNTL